MSSEHGKVVGRGKTSIENITGTLRGQLLPGLREHWGIVLITLLAASFRFAFFDLTQYDFDHSYPAFQALQILEEGRFPTTSLLNPLGLPNPPLMAYIQALPLFFVRSPLAVQVTITLLNLLAVPLTYSLGLRLFDKKTALAAAFLLAITHWGVYFSRASWVQGLLPFFTALIAYLLFPALVEEKPGRRRIFLGLATAALMAQTYLLAYAVVVQLALLIILFRRRLNLRPILAGVAFFTLISLPYTWAVRGGQGENADNVQGFLAGPWRVDGEALGHALRLVTGADFVISGNPLQEPQFTWEANFFPVAELFLIALLAIGSGEGIYRIWRRDAAKGHLLCLIWFFTPVALMTVHSFPVHPHYLLFAYPAGFLLVGRGAHSLWQWRAIPVILGLSLVLIFGERIALTYQAIAQNPNIGRIEWLPLRYSLPIGQTLSDASGDIYIKAPQPWVSAVSGALISSKPDFDESGFIVIRTNHPSLYVLLDPQQLSPAFSLAQELVDQRIALPNDGQIRFFIFPPSSREEVASLPSHPLDLSLDIGWRLLGYDLPRQVRAGDNLTFTSYWLVEDLLPNRHSLFYKPFLHLLDREGRAVVQSDGHGQAGTMWRRGEVFIETVSLSLPANLPPEEYWIRLGLYDPGSSTRALFPDGQDHVLVGPLRIEVGTTLQDEQRG